MTNVLVDLTAWIVGDVTEDGVIPSHSQCLYLCSSSVSVHVPHAYRDIENISAHQSLILYFIEMVLTLHMVFCLESGVIVCSVLARTSGLDLWSLMIVLKYLNCCTVSSFWSWAEMSAVKEL